MECWSEVRRINSSDHNVAKFVFTKKDAVVESVLYKYPTYKDRTVICCSTQSGCPVGCRFCGTGDYFVRSLSGLEIAEQPIKLIEETGVAPRDMERLQIMFMSMGEPMLNYSNLSTACMHLHKFYPNAALLISTSAPRTKAFDRLNKLSQTIPTIGLQFSVHESTDEARKKLVPFKGAMKLEEISETGVRWARATGRRPFFNYCVHGENNTDFDVERLSKLFDPAVWECTVSVICERDESIAASNERQRSLATDFSNKMVAAGFSTRTFNPAGQDDIGGGCGQLWFVQDWMKKNPGVARPSCGNGLGKVHTPRFEAEEKERS